MDVERQQRGFEWYKHQDACLGVRGCLVLCRICSCANDQARGSNHESAIVNHVNHESRIRLQ